MLDIILNIMYSDKYKARTLAIPEKLLCFLASKSSYTAALGIAR